MIQDVFEIFEELKKKEEGGIKDIVLTDYDPLRDETTLMIYSDGELYKIRTFAADPYGHIPVGCKMKMDDDIIEIMKRGCPIDIGIGSVHEDEMITRSPPAYRSPLIVKDINKIISQEHKKIDSELNKEFNKIKDRHFGSMYG